MPDLAYGEAAAKALQRDPNLQEGVASFRNMGMYVAAYYNGLVTDGMPVEVAQVMAVDLSNRLMAIMEDAAKRNNEARTHVKGSLNADGH